MRMRLDYRTEAIERLHSPPPPFPRLTPTSVGNALGWDMPRSRYDVTLLLAVQAILRF